jgi:hypothetical protein
MMTLAIEVGRFLAAVVAHHKQASNSSTGRAAGSGEGSRCKMKDKGGNRDQDHHKGKAKREDAEPLCHLKKFIPAF